MIERIKEWWSGRNSRERLVLGGGGLVVLLIVAYQAGVIPLMEFHAELRAELKEKQKFYDRYQRILAQRQRYEAQAERYTELDQEIESALIPGENAQIAAAELQRLLKQLANEVGIQIQRISPRDSETIEEKFVRVGAALPFQCTTDQLGRLLYRIESSEKLFVIQEVQARVVNYRDPKEIQVNLVVYGFIRSEGESSVS